MRSPNWCASSPPIATTRRAWQRRSHSRRLSCGGGATPLARVVLGRAADRALWRRDHPHQVAHAAHALAGVVEERPQLDAVEAVEVAELDPCPLQALRAA